MEWKYPRCLKKGMTIGCIAPASSSDESLDAIQEYARNMVIRLYLVNLVIALACMGAALRSRHKSLNG